jgi:putative flippase GtrA
MTEFDLPAESAPPGPLLRLVRDQRVAFLGVGIVNTVVGLGIFVVCSETLGHSVDHRFGKIAAAVATLGVTHVLSVLFAFVMHRRFVFRVRGHLLRDLARFWSVYLGAAALNIVALPALVELGLGRIPAQLIIVAMITLMTYFGHRHYSFRRNPADTQGESPGTQNVQPSQPPVNADGVELPADQRD